MRHVVSGRFCNLFEQSSRQRVALTSNEFLDTHQYYKELWKQTDSTVSFAE